MPKPPWLTPDYPEPPAPEPQEPTPTVRACDVCTLAKGNATPKPTFYCGLCDAWICDECRPRWSLRAVAALKRAAKAMLGR